MKQFLEAFTIIDFWGIMVPGGFFVFFLNSFYPLGAVYKDIIGQYVEKPTEFGLAVFLLVVSYIIGSLIHETADAIDAIIRWIVEGIEYLSNKEKEKKPKKAKKGASRDQMSSCRFSKIVFTRKRAFSGLSESLQEKYSTDSGVGGIKIELTTDSITLRKNTNDILTALYSAGKVGKLSLFDSFRVMSRNSALVIGIWLGISVWKHVDVFSADGLTLFTAHHLAAGVLIIIFLFRSIHYSRLKYKYAYESYDRMIQEQEQTSK